MSFIPKLIIIIGLAIGHLTFSNSAYTQELQNSFYVDINQSMGFIMGQNFSLNRIKTEYPELATRAMIVESHFKKSFGNAEKNMDNELRRILEDQYSEYMSTVDESISGSLNSQKINHSLALQFLDEIEMRAKGVIPSPILETLLIYQFAGYPQNEFLQGYKSKYLTVGHLKSKGIDLQVEYPKSWSSREGNRPNVIQFFSSNNGRGPAYALVMTRDLLAEAQDLLTSKEKAVLKTYEGSQALADEIFSKNSLREMAEEVGLYNVREMKSKRIIIDRWPGAMLEFIGEQQRLDLVVTMYTRMYLAIYENYLITLHCQLGEFNGDIDNNLKQNISEYTPLFHLMANSLIIQNQY